MKGPITRSRASRERKGHQCLINYFCSRGCYCSYDTFLAIVMVEFCEELWFRPLSKDLFSTRVVGYPLSLAKDRPAGISLCLTNNKTPETQRTLKELIKLAGPNP